MNSSAAGEATQDAVSATGLKHTTRILSPDAPVIFLVHGRAGNFKVMWSFNRAIPADFNIIAPQAPLPDPIGGFSWWLTGPGDRAEIASARGSATLLHSFIQRAIKFYALTPRKVAGVGFSQGAALLSLLLQRAEGVIDLYAFLAGFVIKVTAAVQIPGTQVLMAHGLRDETVPIDWAKKGHEYLSALGCRVTYAEDPVGHKIGPAGVRALTAFLQDL